MSGLSISKWLHFFLILGYGILWLHVDQARALLEWHNTARFCGNCGGKTVAAEAGRRKQCPNELCKKRIYPRVDPVCDAKLFSLVNIVKLCS